MSVCKMYKVRIELEPKCVCEDSTSRVFMSLVQSRGKAAKVSERDWRHQNLANIQRYRRRWKKFFWKRKARAAFLVVARNLLCILISLLVTGAAWRWLSYTAYLERGYKAYGGECLVAAIIFVIVMRITHWMIAGRNERC